MITSLFKGFWAAVRTPKLALLLWAWSLILGFAAAWPARAWFGPALNVRVETDGLLTRFNMGTFVDLFKYQDTQPVQLLVAAAMGVALIALAGGAFVNGGVLEVLGSQGEPRTFMHRFFRGGGHFFWRYTRLMLLAYGPAVIVAGLVAAAMGALTRPLADSEWEPAGLFWTAVTLLVVGIVAGWFLLALDYARIQVARDDARGMFKAYLKALGFVLRHAIATYAIWVTALVATGALLLAYLWHESTWTVSNWAAIWILIAAQQVLVLARAGVRVAQVAAERAYYAAKSPAVQAAVMAGVPTAVAEPAAVTAPAGMTPLVEIPRVEAPPVEAPVETPGPQVSPVTEAPAGGPTAEPPRS